MSSLPKAFLRASILAMGLTAIPVLAQTTTPAQTPAPATQPTDVQLQNFAQASQKVAMVVEEYQPKLQASPDDNAREQVMKEADEKMVQLVSAEGLTVSEYNGISAAVQEDPKLRERVIELVNKPSN